MNDPELFDFDEHDEVEPTATWAEFQLFKVAEDASKAQIKSAFVKSLSSKKMNKKILGEFIELVA